ncbi:MAG: hypothetical protein ACRDRC_02405 [Pseudonocardiaceae bacterium]
MVCSLVQEIQQAPPYRYTPGEYDASDWFPELVDSGGTHVAYDDAQRPVGRPTADNLL